MFDPFTASTRIATAMLDVAQTGFRAIRMMESSRKIVDRRSDLIGAAMQAPLQGDYVELSRMVPEKVEAFAKSGTVMMTEMMAMQSAYLTEMQAFAQMTMRGRMPTMAECVAQMSRTMTYATHATERMSALSRKMLAPIDQTVAANARRLRLQRAA